MASANQFIGSKISLISKSEIRYEGILYSLDLTEATISLAKVRSFGTEDRPTERPVAPKDDVYEFIIFRGLDIKGIDVLEPPKAAPSGGPPNDPAIVEASSLQHPVPPPQYPPRDPEPMKPFGMHPQHKPQQVTSELHSSFEQAGGGGPHHPNFESSRSNASTPSAYSSNRKSPTNDAGVQVNDDKRGGRNNRQQNNRQNDNRAQPRGNGRGRGGGYQQQQQQQYQQQQPQQQHQQNRGRGGYQPRGNGQQQQQQQQGGGGYRGGRGQGVTGRGYHQQRNHGVFVAQMPPKMTFEEAFDFEKANEEIQTMISKIKIKDEEKEKEEGEATLPVEGKDEQENKEPEVFYKKDNFFDSISCEALERSKGPVNRVDWRAERKLNAETFGISPNGPRRGGGYRGYRGGYRGGQGGRGYGGNRGYRGYNRGYNNSGYNNV